MSAAVTTYTTYADIRAALGVSDEDLEDVTLALSIYADYLEVELEEVDIALPGTFATLAALTPPSPPSPAQARLLSSVRLFSAFAVAKQLTASLPLFAAKQVGDGKAVVSRFDNPYKDTISKVNQQYDRMRNRVLSSLVALGSTDSSVTRVLFAVAAGATDPVTGT